jgi:hypothetical protein
MLYPHIFGREPVAFFIIAATLRTSARLCGSSMALINALTLAPVGRVLLSAIAVA